MSIIDRDQFAELLSSVLDHPDTPSSARAIVLADLDAASRRVLARLLDAERVLDRVVTMLGQLRDEVSDAIDTLTTTTKGTP
jgi:hypothetical protein